MRRVLPLLCVALALGRSASATPILDVAVDEQKGGGFSPFAFGSTQSFIVGTTGTLTQIDVKIYSEFDLDELALTLREYDPANGSGSGLEVSTLTNLSTENQPPGTWFSFPFST